MAEPLEKIGRVCYNESMRGKLSKKKKIAIGILTPVGALLAAFLVLCIVTMCMYSPTYLGRVLTHWDSSVSDYKFFPARTIEKSDRPYSYKKNIRSSLDGITVNYSDKQKPLREFVKSTDTTSFLIVKNDEIVYEKYENGYREDFVNTSFSMAKSVVSLLVGRAVESGYIESITQPISAYIDELEDTEIGKTTIEELLLMRSGIEYNERKFLWFGDDSLTYWHPDLRKLALSHTDCGENARTFRYNNYHPLLLGIILERSTGCTVSEYFERELWRKIGAEHDASWSLDSKKSGFEKMESGINFRAVDFLKIGSMVLHDGVWNGTRVIGENWLRASTLCDFPLDEREYNGTFLAGKNTGYKYMWYCTPSPQSGYDIVAWGKSDQILYISPANDTVVLRTGKTDGGVSDWVATIKQIITSANGV